MALITKRFFDVDNANRQDFLIGCLFREGRDDMSAAPLTQDISKGFYAICATEDMF